MKKNEKAEGTEKSRRLNVVLDRTSFGHMETIRVACGDSSFTQSIKRAIAFLAFVDDQEARGQEVYLGKKGVPKMKVVQVS